ncbi:hypothetical protein LCGC14_0477970 [marine sediment metagenome]|uniref:HNH nuclease domain-containing protein n=1 Tax=marine sediment metagenome TaxID=412755 RepID=A0A0F9UXF1_9ZZZZ
MSDYNTTSKKGKTVLKHRLIWEEHYGKIPNGKIIHHINRERKDNRIENLQMVSRGEHTKLHPKKRNIRNRLYFHTNPQKPKDI